MDESDSYLEKDPQTDANSPAEPRTTPNRRAKKEKEPPPSEEARRMTQLVQSVEKEFGKGSITRLGEVDSLEPMAVIPSGSLALDKALGVGGYPRGRIVEIFGPESSGKTTLALHAIAQAQAAGGVAAFIDAEHAFDLRYAKAIGVDLDRLLVSQPDNGEQALDIAELLSKSGDVALVVVDSVAALVPKAELEGDMGEPHMGLHARLMSQATRKLNGVCSRTDTTLVFINQLRMKLGVVFGNPETTTGGAALKYYASVRLDVRRIGKVSIGDTVVGNRTRVKVVKNKVAPPFTEAEFDIRWGKGVDEAADLIEMALACGILEKNGSHLVLDGKSIGQGRDRARDALLGDGDLLEYVRLATIESLPGQTSRALPPVKAGGARDAAEAAA